MGDFPEYPRASLRRAANHHGVRPGGDKDLTRLVGAMDIAIGHDGNMQCGFHRSDGLVFGLPAIALLAGSAMDSDHGDASALCSQCNRQGVLLALAPAGAHLERDRHTVRCAGLHYCVDDFQRQSLVLHKRRTGPFVTHFFGRAAHVDVNDLRATVDVVARRIGHHGRIGTCNLYRNWARLALVIGAPRGLE